MLQIRMFIFIVGAATSENVPSSSEQSNQPGHLQSKAKSFNSDKEDYNQTARTRRLM